MIIIVFNFIKFTWVSTEWLKKRNLVEFIKNLIQKETLHCLRHKEAQALIELLFVDVDGSQETFKFINLLIYCHLQENPEKVGKNSVCAGTFGTAFPLLVLEIIEHVGDTTGECQHDNEESYQEHHHVLHHCVDTEDDGAEVL